MVGLWVKMGLASWEKLVAICNWILDAVVHLIVKIPAYSKGVVPSNIQRLRPDIVASLKKHGKTSLTQPNTYPPWELRYPINNHIWTWCFFMFFPQGGRYVSLLEDILVGIPIPPIFAALQLPAIKQQTLASARVAWSSASSFPSRPDSKICASHLHNVSFDHSPMVVAHSNS